MRNFILVFLLLIGTSFIAEKPTTFTALMEKFDAGYRELQLPGFSYDYKENFNSIANESSLEKQEAFFLSIQYDLKKINPKKLSRQERIYYDHIAYEAKLNLERISLEKSFIKTKVIVPGNGLSGLDKSWYQYYVHFFTGVHITPDELFAFGEKEVARVKNEIKVIQKELGYENDSAGFYKHLKSENFFLNDKAQIIAEYEKKKKFVYQNAHKIFKDTSIANIAFMTWPDAGLFTPPGFYNPKEENAYGVAVFHFNFYGEKHNTRSMDWIFMHEAVPGHHYQWCIKEKLKHQPAFMKNFFYPGNFEGWGAYVEYLGKEIGLYADPYSYLGKWEWDLVRSTRILIDVGIHYKGWTKEQAIACWKKNIPGQDEIAEREVTRCTNWPAQALSYKVGADRIEKMKQKIKSKLGKKFSLQEFHHAYLMFGSAPLEVIEKNMN